MYERAGRVAIYSGGFGIAYFVIERVPPMKGAVPALIVLWLLLALSEVTERHGLQDIIRWTGVTLAVSLLPWKSYRLQGAAVVMTIGVAIVSNAKRTGIERIVRGVGVATFLWGMSTVPAMAGIKEVFLCAGMAVLGAYTVAEYAKSREWSPQADASIVPAGILGGLSGLYLDFGGELVKGHPSLAFYGRWLSLAGAVIVTAVWAYTIIPEEHPEEVITKREGMGITSTWGEKAIKEFILTGRKAALISYIAYYGRDALPTKEELRRVLSKISEYREYRIPKLMPHWLKKRYAQKEVERRRKLVEEVLKEIDLLIKGDIE